MLELNNYEHLPALELVRPEKQKNPLVAFALSLIFPGLGHLYLGLTARALWAAGFQCLGIILITMQGTLHGQGILMVPSIYCFAALDAYFAAREWNAGALDRLTGANPRIAAIINLLTKGFGYFYLGDRTKGVICFIVVGAVQAVLTFKPSVLVSILSITIQVAIAVDVYRVARQRLLANNPELAGSAISDANPSLVPTWVPCIIVAALGLSASLGWGALIALSSQYISRGGQLENSSNGLLYINKAEKLQFLAPPDWETVPVKSSLIAIRSDECSFIVLDHYSPVATGTQLELERDVFLKDHPKATTTPHESSFASHSAEGFDTTYSDADGSSITQSIIEVRHGLKMFAFVETDQGPSCKKDFNSIAASMKF